MLYRWQAHNDLALSVGDAITITSDMENNLEALPDGARFNAYHRDNALYRAELEILRKIISSMISLDNKTIATFLQRMLPNMIYNSTDANFSEMTENIYGLRELQATVSNVAIVIDLMYMGTNYWYPIPIKDRITAHGLLSSRNNTQIPDLFALLHQLNGQTIISVYDGKEEIESLDTIRYSYIPYPVHPYTLNNNDLIIMEDGYTSMMIAYAKMYLLIDSQEIDSASFLQLELGGYENANNRYSNNNLPPQ